MLKRKEYNDRWNSPLVNKPITLQEYNAKTEIGFCAWCNDHGKLKYNEGHWYCSYCVNPTKRR